MKKYISSETPMMGSKKIAHGKKRKNLPRSGLIFSFFFWKKEKNKNPINPVE
jgi:hypothetical protein